MYKYKATVVNVVDGDTVDAVINLGFHTSIKLRFRLFGINTPEMHKDTIVQANAAKVRVEELLLNKECIADTFKPDKYGRWLANFTVVNSTGTTINVNETLIKEGLAIQY